MITIAITTITAIGHFCDGEGYFCDGVLPVVRNWNILPHYADCTSFNYPGTYALVHTPICMEALLHIMLFYNTLFY